jgi:hypothetical protein
MTITTASRFNVTVFAPVLFAFLFPALFLLPEGVLFTLIAMSDPTVPLTSAFSYDMWIIGPIMIAIGLFCAGRGLYCLYMQGHSFRSVWIATWALFSLMLFLALWTSFIILTSLGASETPMHIFLSLTALFAGGLVLSTQVLVIPWLVHVFRMLPNSKVMALTVLGNKGLKKE